uniref:Uncharacterized protein n=1 Tax=Caenorhabditis japonica TaxID=281687 RepID=A0A8R1DJR8_CAEJA
MISLRLALFVALFPVLTSGVDLGALLWSSRDSTQVMCRYVFFSYVFIFTVTIVAVHAYASASEPCFAATLFCIFS